MKRNRKKKEISITFRIKFSKIILKRITFCLTCKLNWFFARNSWIARQKRSRESCRTKKRFWCSFIQFFNHWQRLWLHRFVIHWFYHWNKRFCIIQFFDLFEIANHWSRFVAQNLVVFFIYFISSFISKFRRFLKELISVQISLIKEELFSFFIIFNYSFRLKLFIVFYMIEISRLVKNR
jgi:hypothetical protein